jgi:hypothetical protein
MTITIRTNPEIVIEVESIKEEKKFERRIVVPDGKIAPDVKSEPVANIKKREGVRHFKKCGEACHRSD